MNVFRFDETSELATYEAYREPNPPYVPSNIYDHIIWEPTYHIFCFDFLPITMQWSGVKPLLGVPVEVKTMFLHYFQKQVKPWILTAKAEVPLFWDGHWFNIIHLVLTRNKPFGNASQILTGDRIKCTAKPCFLYFLSTWCARC